MMSALPHVAKSFSDFYTWSIFSKRQDKHHLVIIVVFDILALLIR